MDECKEHLIDELVDCLFNQSADSLDMQKLDTILEKLEEIDLISSEWSVEESLREYWKKLEPEQARKLATEMDSQM